MFTQQDRVRLIAGTVGVVVVAVSLVATVAGVSAQTPAGGRFGPGGPGGPGRGHAGLVGGPLLRLGSLTEAQRDQLRALTAQHRDELRTLARQAADARRALETSAEAGQVDETKATELGAATSALALARARVQAEAFGLLTPEQKAEVAKRRHDMREWLQARPDGAARGRGGRFGGGPPR